MLALLTLPVCTNENKAEESNFKSVLGDEGDNCKERVCGERIFAAKVEDFDLKNKIVLKIFQKT